MDAALAQGATMDSAVSTVVANLYMEFFEELALESAPSRPRFWKQYVDDTCCIIRRGDVEPLLHHLSDVRPTINFTICNSTTSHICQAFTESKKPLLNAASTGLNIVYAECKLFVIGSISGFIYHNGEKNELYGSVQEWFHEQYCHRCQ